MRSDSKGQDSAEGEFLPVEDRQFAGQMAAETLSDESFVTCSHRSG